MDVGWFVDVMVVLVLCVSVVLMVMSIVFEVFVDVLDVFGEWCCDFLVYLLILLCMVKVSGCGGFYFELEFVLEVICV